MSAWDGPFGLPPFARVAPEHFAPAFEAAMAQHRAEVEAIASLKQAPSFDNTVAALDRSGQALERVAMLFHTLGASTSSEDLQAVQREMAAPLAAHRSAVTMHPGVFDRLQTLQRQDCAGELDLAPDQQRLLQRVHLECVRAGAQLQGQDRARYAQLAQELASCHTQFAQNVLHDESHWQLPLPDEAHLAGLPQALRDNLRQAAQQRGLNGHVLPLSRTLIDPFLVHSTRRDLREHAWRAWRSRGEHPGEHDNRPVARRILQLRQEQARLLGYLHYADYALADTMAGKPQAVLDLMVQVWQRAVPAAAADQQTLQALAGSCGAPLPLQAWDWRHWAEQVRVRDFDVDDAQVSPYFPLERVAQAAFDCAQRLFGLSFVRRPDIASYHEDVHTYEVRDRTGAMVGLFMQDNFARPTKRSGAWMNPLRWQSRNAASCDAGVADAEAGLGAPQLPIILNTNNFAKAQPGTPTLLSLDDARTLFTSLGMACTACCPTCATPVCRARRCCAISSSCLRSCSSTGSTNRRCCASMHAIGRRTSPSPTPCWRGCRRPAASTVPTKPCAMWPARCWTWMCTVARWSRCPRTCASTRLSAARRWAYRQQWD